MPLPASWDASTDPIALPIAAVVVFASPAVLVVAAVTVLLVQVMVGYASFALRLAFQLSTLASFIFILEPAFLKTSNSSHENEDRSNPNFCQQLRLRYD